MVDGRRLDGYTISSPCEPKGSGELKSRFSHDAAYINLSIHTSNMNTCYSFTKFIFIFKDFQKYFSCLFSVL